MVQLFLSRLGISQLNPMQQAASAAIQQGKDVVLLSPTGSGKTLAFLLPLMGMFDKERKGVQALILAPSRELVLQIEQVFRKLQTGFKVNSCYGGHPVATERNNLKEPPMLLIGTPGRIADHIRRQHVDLSCISTLVLDEFDKSLELGFFNEMEFITARLGNLKTRVLTSATNIDVIPEFTGVIHPEILDFTSVGGPAQLQLKAVRAEGADKLEALFNLICSLGGEASLIFCNHREAVERISGHLNAVGLTHGTYHGGLEQEDRELALIRFRNGTHHILLTTDLASRGLDIPEIRHVIHYQFPATVTSWTHRNGRTARMHASGVAWLVMAGDEMIPSYIADTVRFVSIKSPLPLPDPSPWETIYIGLGKKDKLSKSDVAGFLMQKGGLDKDELGRIEILDYASFAAVSRDKVSLLLKQVAGELIKRKTAKIAVARK